MALLRYSDVKDFESVCLVIEDNEEKVSEAARLKLCKIKEETLSKISTIFEEGIFRAKLKGENKVLQEVQNSASTTIEELKKKLHQERKTKDILNERESTTGRLLTQYEKYTGMKIRPFEGIGKAVGDTSWSAISITFTNIDEYNPSRYFEFVLMTDGKKYNVGSCTPPICGMDELIGELNKTLDISSFIINVRKKFKETLSV